MYSNERILEIAQAHFQQEIPALFPAIVQQTTSSLLQACQTPQFAKTHSRLGLSHLTAFQMMLYKDVDLATLTDEPLPDIKTEYPSLYEALQMSKADIKNEQHMQPPTVNSLFYMGLHQVLMQTFESDNYHSSSTYDSRQHSTVNSPTTSLPLSHSHESIADSVVTDKSEREDKDERVVEQMLNLFIGLIRLYTFEEWKFQVGNETFCFMQSCDTDEKELRFAAEEFICRTINDGSINLYKETGEKQNPLRVVTTCGNLFDVEVKRRNHTKTASARGAQEMAHILGSMSLRHKNMGCVGGPGLMLRGHHRKVSFGICVADDEYFTALNTGINQKMSAILHTRERDLANPEQRVLFANEFLALFRHAKQVTIRGLQSRGVKRPLDVSTNVV